MTDCNSIVLGQSLGETENKLTLKFKERFCQTLYEASAAQLFLLYPPSFYSVAPLGTYSVDSRKDYSYLKLFQHTHGHVSIKTDLENTNLSCKSVHITTKTAAESYQYSGEVLVTLLAIGCNGVDVFRASD